MVQVPLNSSPVALPPPCPPETPPTSPAALRQASESLAPPSALAAGHHPLGALWPLTQPLLPRLPPPHCVAQPGPCTKDPARRRHSVHCGQGADRGRNGWMASARTCKPSSPERARVRFRLPFLTPPGLFAQKNRKHLLPFVPPTAPSCHPKAFYWALPGPQPMRSGLADMATQ